MEIISKATAIYTGGGIYIYYGQLDNGDYFLRDDESPRYCMFLNSDPKDLNVSLYEEWQTKHKVGEYSGEEAIIFNKAVIKWIIENAPEGNYEVSELETRLERLG